MIWPDMTPADAAAYRTEQVALSDLRLGDRILMPIHDDGEHLIGYDGPYEVAELTLYTDAWKLRQADITLSGGSKGGDQFCWPADETVLRLIA